MAPYAESPKPDVPVAVSLPNHSTGLYCSPEALNK